MCADNSLEKLSKIVISKWTELCGGDIEDVTLWQVNALSVNIAYNCKLYWQQRTDIIHEQDFELYRLTTNLLSGLTKEQAIEKGFTPSFGDGILFLTTNSHGEMERNIVDGIKSIIISSSLNVKSGGLSRFITH